MQVRHLLSGDVFNVDEILVKVHLSDSQGAKRRISMEQFKKYYIGVEENHRVSRGFAQSIARESEVFTEPLIIRIDFSGEKAEVAKGSKPSKKGVTLQELCTEVGIDSTRARRILRSSKVDKPGESWTWPEGPQLREVRDLLKKNLRKS